MKFSIVIDTVSDAIDILADKFRDDLEPKVEELNKNCNLKIGVAIRCLPESYNRRSFTRYTLKDNYLTIDFCLPLEKYEDMSKVEQVYNLGQEFLKWLKQGLSNKNLIKQNPQINIEELFTEIKKIGLQFGWFKDEIDWEDYLD